MTGSAIYETPLVDRVQIYMYRPYDGTFALGHSILGGTDVLGRLDQYENLVPLVSGTIVIARGLTENGTQRTSAPGTLSFTLADADLSELWWLTPGKVVAVYQSNADHSKDLGNLFTGHVTAISTSEELIDGKLHAFVHVTATDYVQTLAALQRSGSANPTGQTFTSVRDLFEDLLNDAMNLKTLSIYVVEHFSDAVDYFNSHGFDSQSIYFAAGSTTSTEIAKWTAPSNGSVAASGSSVKLTSTDSNPAAFVRTLYGLIPGRMYSIEIDGLTNAPTVTVDGASILASAANLTGTTLNLGFIARSTASTLTITVPGGSSTQFSAISVWSYLNGDPIAAVSTVYDGPIATHLDMLAASMPHGYWFIDARGYLQFGDILPADDPNSTATPLPTQVLSDEPVPDPRPDTFTRYTNITRTFDTADLVNTLTLTQRGRTLSSDGNNWDDLSTAYTSTDFNSVAQWGSTADTFDSVAASIDTINAIIKSRLSVYATPTNRVRSVTINQQETPDGIYQNRLDLLRPVIVQYRGTEDTYLISGITHTISPTRWMTELTLTRKE